MPQPDEDSEITSASVIEMLNQEEGEAIKDGEEISFTVTCFGQGDQILCERRPLAGTSEVRELQDLLFGSAEERKLSTALAAAMDRGRARVAEILAAPDMLSSDEFANRLDVSRMTVKNWTDKGRILALEGAVRGRRYPSWQIAADGKPIEDIAEVLQIFGNDAWAAFRFLISANDELGGGPVWQALHNGRHERVVALARNYVEVGFG